MADTLSPERQQKENARYEAVQLMTHYFETAFKRAGAQWSSDNDAEIRQLVDGIIFAATGTAS